MKSRVNDIARVNRMHRMSILVCIFLSSLSCKGPIPEASYSAKSAADDGTVEYQVNINWNRAGSGTTFEVRDESNKKTEVIPLSLRLVKKSGKIKIATPTKWFRLHSDGADDLPSFEVKLQTKGKGQWCYTPKSINLAVDQKMTCINSNSSKGKFAKFCMDANGRIKKSDSKFECTYRINKDVAGAVEFNKKYVEGEKIEYLSDFLMLSRNCKIRSATESSKINEKDNRLCNCNDLQKKKTISYNMWHVAGYLREIIKAPNPRIMQMKFKEMCINHAPLPYPVKKKSEEPVVPKIELSADAATNLRICDRLKRFGTALDFVEKTSTCLCFDFAARTASGAGGNNGVKITDYDPIDFIRECVNLKEITNDNEFCTRIGMLEVAKVNVAPNPEILTCKRQVELLDYKSQCEYQRNSDSAEFFYNCLLHPKSSNDPITVSP